MGKNKGVILPESKRVKNFGKIEEIVLISSKKDFCKTEVR